MSKLANGAIVNIAPFVGSHSEDYGFPSNQVTFQNLDVMGGLASITNLTNGGSIKIELNSNFNGDNVVPRSGPKIMGQLGILRWEFNQGVSQFGSWFENNSGTDDAVIEFFDASGVSLGSRNVTTSATSQQWTWNGWESDVPISSMIVTGNSSQFLNGFIWYDDSQATVAAVPEPGASTLLIAALVLTGMRRTRNS